MKARLKYYLKHKIRNRYVIELSIHEVGKSVRYPDGIKYGLICKDLKSGKLVLFDNHHPKGPHIHIGDCEYPYIYVSDDQLVRDFEMLVLKEMGIKL